MQINYCDVGARGNLEEPWVSNESSLQVYGFEADPQEMNRLQQCYPNRKYFPFALHSSEIGEKELFLTNDRSQSSIYPPSESNKQFESIHWKNRQVEKVINVPISTLDIALADCNIDAVKIDTQGGEWDILNGASYLLSNQSPILFLETWCHEVYSGAPLMGEILTFLSRFGYEVWAVEPAAEWGYEIPLQNKHSRQRLVGLNLMLVPSFDALRGLPDDRLRARIEILSWYGFLDVAFLFAKEINDIALMRKIEKKISRGNSLFFRAIDKVARLLNKARKFPAIT
jgi:FkbM family methyltransferase